MLCLCSDQSQFMALFVGLNLWIGPGFIFESSSSSFYCYYLWTRSVLRFYCFYDAQCLRTAASKGSTRFDASLLENRNRADF